MDIKKKIKKLIDGCKTVVTSNTTVIHSQTVTINGDVKNSTITMDGKTLKGKKAQKAMDKVTAATHKAFKDWGGTMDEFSDALRDL